MPSKLKNIPPTIPFSWVPLLAALVIGAALVGRCDRAQAQLVPAGADFQPNAECDTFSVVIQRTRDLDAECPGAPARCTVACGAALFPFLDECGSFVNALSVFDAADGVRDDQAGTFVELREACNGIPSGQIIGELQPL